MFESDTVHDHGALLGGTFKLWIGDPVNGYPVAVWSSTTRSYSNYNIPAGIGQDSLANALRQIPGLESTHVRRTGDPAWGANWLITYYGAKFDIPDLYFDGDRLTGGKLQFPPKISFF